MLVISRKDTESVRIGDAVVTIRTQSSGRVSLLISAPREVAVIRTELEERHGDSSTPAA